MTIKQQAKKLYKSINYGIKYSNGVPIAYYPYYAGGSCFDASGEKVCNTLQEAKQFLHYKTMDHALEIAKNEEWENENEWDYIRKSKEYYRRH